VGTTGPMVGHLLRRTHVRNGDLALLLLLLSFLLLSSTVASSVASAVAAAVLLLQLSVGAGQWMHNMCVD